MFESIADAVTQTTDLREIRRDLQVGRSPDPALMLAILDAMEQEHDEQGTALADTVGSDDRIQYLEQEGKRNSAG
jgi:hypothetical protein